MLKQLRQTLVFGHIVTKFGHGDLFQAPLDVDVVESIATVLEHRFAVKRKDTISVLL